MNVKFTNIFNKEEIKSINKFVLKLCICLFILWIAFAAYMYFNQDKMLFFPQTINKQAVQAFEENNKNIEELNIKTSDNNTLNGWLVKNTDREKSPLIIYLGGNAEEVSYMINNTEKFKGWTWALLNYRGYGLSTGKPSEDNLFNDSVLIYDYLCNREDIDKEKIVIFGRSLGTGVALYLAQNRQVNGVILATPYDSMVSVAQEKFPFLPVNLILKYKFDSLKRAKDIKTPVLVLAAGNDEVIPIKHAENLAAKIGVQCTLRTISNEGHNTISNNSLYWDYIEQFLERFK